MRVALLHNPYYHQDFMENLEFVANNFGTLPPLGIMYVSSILKDRGHETEIIDVKAEELDEEEVFERLEELEPDAAGVMVIPFTAGISLSWARKIKNKFEVPLISGNYGASKYPEATCSNDYIDYVIIGSALESLPRLLEAIEKDEKPDGVEGVAWKTEEGMKINPPEKRVEDFEKLPFPDRDQIDHSNYGSMASKADKFTIMVTSYGCIYGCTFCDMGNFGYSERKPGEVVDEIEEIVNKHGIDEIDFFDRDFLIGRDRSRQICREIIDRGIEVEWSCRTRVDQVDKETLELMKEAGCRLIMYGIESGNEEILEKDHKGITRGQIEKAVNMTRETGIETLGFFIIGHPGETEEEIRQTIDFSKQLQLDYAQFFKMTGKPGSRLYKDVKDELGYDYFEKLIAGETEEKELPRPWTDMENDEIEEWVKQAYREFYLRPEYVLRRLRKVESASEFKKNAKIAFRLAISVIL